MTRRSSSSPAVRPAARGSRVGGGTGRRSGRSRLGGSVSTLLLALVLVAAGVGTQAAPAQAASYPTWDDVLAARSSETAKQAQIDKLQSLLDTLRTDAADAQSEAERLGNEFQRAQQAADEQALTVDQLQAQADEQGAIADESERRAGQVTAQLARTGGGNVTTQLVGDTEGADDLLYRLGAMSKLTEQTDGIRAQAVQDRNTATSLADKATVARDALRDKQADAETAMTAAQQASDAAAAAVVEKEANEADLQSQLDVLQDATLQTEADFQAGVEEARRVAAERAAAAAAAKAAAEEQARQAAAAAAAAAAARPAPAPAPAPAPRPGGGGGAAPAPTPAPAPNPGSGWARPSGGYLSSGYGMRVNPVTHVYTLHAGIDLAPGCGAPIVAAGGGTVEYAGAYGSYGNYVRINHGGGVTTAYAHIQNGGIRVSVGQRVSAGQLIALVGTTGNSTGCHLHFETRVGGSPQNPVPFMAARGVSL